MHLLHPFFVLIVLENHVEGINVYSLHPGVINTNLKRHVNFPMKSYFKKFIKTPEEGARTTIFCAVHEMCANETGLYYGNCKPSYVSHITRKKKVAKKLWDASLKMSGLNEHFNPFISETKL